jgi:hypothetical protein
MSKAKTIQVINLLVDRLEGAHIAYGNFRVERNELKNQVKKLTDENKKLATEKSILEMKLKGTTQLAKNLLSKDKDKLDSFESKLRKLK